MEERNLNSWQEFKNELAGLRSEHDKLREADAAPLLFRGQPDASRSPTTPNGDLQRTIPYSRRVSINKELSGN
jgi:hypothetical protein